MRLSEMNLSAIGLSGMGLAAMGGDAPACPTTASRKPSRSTRLRFAQAGVFGTPLTCLQNLMRKLNDLLPRFLGFAALRSECRRLISDGDEGEGVGCYRHVERTVDEVQRLWR